MKATHPVHIHPKHNVTIFYPASFFPLPESKPLFIDIGPGRGDFLFHLAKTHPEGIALGIEIKRIRSDNIVRRLENMQIKNCALVHGDARVVMPLLFSNPCACSININFPDPWPKLKHKKNRVLCKQMFESCANALTEGGLLTVATDVGGYLEAATKSGVVPKNLAEIQSYEGDGRDVFPTYFAEKWKKEGRTIFLKKWIKTK